MVCRKTLKPSAAHSKNRKRNGKVKTTDETGGVDFAFVFAEIILLLCKYE